MTPKEVAGSSPLSRGIRLVLGKSGLTGGIIPALAGNTFPRRRGGGIPRDHPRSRGEYTDSHQATTKALGSSPLSRGIHAVALNWVALTRIIPALAGNTPGGFLLGFTSADHPRSRGEYPVDELFLHAAEGSSPLSRGLLPCPFP